MGGCGVRSLRKGQVVKIFFKSSRVEVRLRVVVLGEYLINLQNPGDKSFSGETKRTVLCGVVLGWVGLVKLYSCISLFFFFRRGSILIFFLFLLYF